MNVDDWERQAREGVPGVTTGVGSTGVAGRRQQLARVCALGVLAFLGGLAFITLSVVTIVCAYVIAVGWLWLLGQ